MNKKIKHEENKNVLKQFLSSENLKKLKLDFKEKVTDVQKEFKQFVKLFHEKIPSGTTAFNVIDKVELILMNQTKLMTKIYKDLKEINSFSKFKDSQQIEKENLETYRKEVEFAIKEKKENKKSFSKEWLKEKDRELKNTKRSTVKNREQDMER